MKTNDKYARLNYCQNKRENRYGQFTIISGTHTYRPFPGAGGTVTSHRQLWCGGDLLIDIESCRSYGFTESRGRGHMLAVDSPKADDHDGGEGWTEGDMVSLFDKTVSLAKKLNAPLLAKARRKSKEFTSHPIPVIMAPICF